MVNLKVKKAFPKRVQEASWSAGSNNRISVFLYHMDKIHNPELRLLLSAPFSKMFFYLPNRVRNSKSAIIPKCNFIFGLVIPKTKKGVKEIIWKCKKQQSASKMTLPSALFTWSLDCGPSSLGPILNTSSITPTLQLP